MKLKKVLTVLALMSVMALALPQVESIGYTYTNYTSYQVVVNTELNVRNSNGEIVRTLQNGELIAASDPDTNGMRKLRARDEYVSAAYTKKVSWKNYTAYTVKENTYAKYGPRNIYNNVNPQYTKGTIVIVADAINGYRKIYGKEEYILNSKVSSINWGEYKSYTVSVSSGSLNVRRGPGTNFDIIGEYSKGVSIKASSNSINGWKKIEGKEQYVSASYVTLNSSSSSSTTTSTTTNTTYKNYANYVVTVSSGVLNVRDKASTSGNIVRELENGEIIKASEPVNGWSKIEGKEQYVSASYIKLSSSSSSSTTTTTTYKNYATYVVSVSSGALNVRDKASTSGNIVRQLENGETIKASDAVNGWRKIEGKEQYVSASYTKLYSSSSSSTTSKNITLIKVNCSTNLVYCYNSAGTRIYKFQCTVGMKGHETPKGTFYIYGRETNHWSDAYSAWMPYTSWIAGTNGCAFHVGSLYAQSHGCVHLSEEAAKIIFNQAKDGTTVQIY